MIARAAIPYVDVAGQHAPLKADLLAAVERVLDHGRFVLGPEVDEFEQRLAELAGVPEAVAVGNGTDALVLALRALGVGAGDEVITAPNSFVSTASAIVLAGATPAFADVGDDYTLDPAQVEAAVTERTRAILPVHLTGRPARMDELRAIADRHGLLVVEDAAQAVGAGYRGRPVGSLGDAGCFSLHPLKTLGAAGDGGAVTTGDPALAQRLRTLRNIGLRTRDECETWSGNSRLDTLQAAILLVKLRYLEEWTEARIAHARRYRELLAELDGVRFPDDPPHLRAVYHTFVIEADRRDALRDHLRERGIGTGVHYPVPIHLQPAARELGYGPGAFPVAERQATRILSLPVYPELTTGDVEHVATTIRAFYEAA